MRPTNPKRWLLFALALTAAALIHRGVPAEDTGAGLRVIVHAENPTPSLTRKEVSALMLKKSTRWNDGIAAHPVDLTPSAPVRDLFTERILGRSTKTIVHYWQRQVFSGGSVPPPTVATEEEVVAYVRSHPGGIGYVSAATPLVGVRELTVVAR